VSAGASPSAPAARLPLFRIAFDAITLREAARQVLAWVAARSSRGRYVVPTNLMSLVLLREHAALCAAYADASLVVADGAPIVAASRILGPPLPERVTGIDLVSSVLEIADPGLRVFLLGARPGVAFRAARAIEYRWPSVRVVGVNSPPLGFESAPGCSEAILAEIKDSRPDLLVVGLGCPKQEIWVHQHHRANWASVTICAGATIDFLAGNKQRAPVGLRQFGLEWLHRLASEPRRLGPRYARCAWTLPWLLWDEWRARRDP
jgi:N-acetylglucosaminyldiphosphoundecaprenol N-acetyl-beta-D-mannosaminyltransferase